MKEEDTNGIDMVWKPKTSNPMISTPGTISGGQRREVQQIKVSVK